MSDPELQRPKENIFVFDQIQTLFLEKKLPFNCKDVRLSHLSVRLFLLNLLPRFFFFWFKRSQIGFRPYNLIVWVGNVHSQKRWNLWATMLSRTIFSENDELTPKLTMAPMVPMPRHIYQRELAEYEKEVWWNQFVFNVSTVCFGFFVFLKFRFSSSTSFIIYIKTPSSNLLLQYFHQYFLLIQ